MTAPGELRHRVTFEAPVDTPDGAGGAIRSWLPVATLWAAIEPAGATETGSEAGIETRVGLRIVIRWRAGIDATLRARLGARVFRLAAVFDPDQRRRTLVCLAEEHDPEPAP